MSKFRRFINAVLVSAAGSILLVGVDFLVGMLKNRRDDARFDAMVQRTVREELEKILAEYPQVSEELERRQLEQKRK